MANETPSTPTPQAAAGGDMTKVLIDGSPVQMPTADILLGDGTPNVPVLRAVLLTYSATTANAEITHRKDASGKTEVLVTRRAGAKGISVSANGIVTGGANLRETTAPPARHGEQCEEARWTAPGDSVIRVEFVGDAVLPAELVAPSATYAAILEHLSRVRRRRNPARVMAELLAAMEVRRGISLGDLHALQPDIHRALERGIAAEHRASDIPLRLSRLAPRRARTGVIYGL